MAEFLEIAPTAEVPSTRTKHANPVCDGPCPTCGQRVLMGATREGRPVVVELTAQRVYTVVWHKPDAVPLMSESRGYVVHQCAAV
jgi:hypothetical protein